MLNCSMPAENVFNQSIWGDEGFSAILSMKSIPDILKIISRDTSPPLWNIFEHLVFRYLGSSEVYIRGLAFFFFLGTVFFTYKIGSFIFSRKTGFLAALVTFLNPFFFIYAFEGRMYSIMALGVTASMYYFLRIFKNEDGIRKQDQIGYVVFTLWALYSHHFAFFAVLMQGVWWLYELIFGKRVRAKKMFRLFLITGVGYVPWIYPLYTQTKRVGGGFWLGTPNLTDLRNLIYDYLAEGIKQHPYVVPLLDKRLHQIALYLVLIALLLRNWLKNFKSAFFLLLWFLLPIGATWVISQRFQSIFFNRYLLYTIPGAMLLLSSSRRRLLSPTLLAAIVILFAVIDFYYFTHPTKPSFREYAAYVKSVKKEEDFLINWNSKSHHLWETKYYGIGGPIYIPSGGNLPFFVGTALMEESDIIKEIPKGVSKVGVITSGPVDEITLPGYTELEVKTFPDLNFVWYTKNGKNP